MHINKEQKTSFSPSNRQENHLWIDFINGDDKSFELIYKKYVGVLFVMAFNSLKTKIL